MNSILYFVLFSFKYKNEINNHLKKVSGKREKRIKWLVINSYCSLFGNFHQNELLLKLFYIREQNEQAIAFFYEMR